MSRKAVFFDADGTVCDMKKGVPDSAIEAIRALVDKDTKRGSAQEEAVRLYLGIWSRFLLQE